MAKSLPLDQMPQGSDKRVDGWNRYLILPPNGSKPIGYTRATTVAKTLDSGGGLAPWKSSMTATGMIINRGLRTRWEALLAEYGDPWYANDQSKRLCQELVEECAAVGGSNERRDIGSALHKISALVDLGREPRHLTEETERDINAYVEGRTAAGIEIVPDMVEFTVVLDEYQVAGTPDRLATVPGFELPLIADLKTGANLDYSWQSIAVQLAIYSRANAIYEQGPAPDGSQDKRIPIPAINKQYGLIFWLNAGTAQLELYLVNLEMGWEAFAHSMWTRGWRNANPQSKYTPVDLVPQLQASIDRATGEITVSTGQVTTPAEATPADAGHSPVAPTNQSNDDTGDTDDDSQLSDMQAIRDWLQTRINEIGEHPNAADTLVERWPKGMPSLRASNAHTADDLAAIEELLDAVEARWEMYFLAEPKPGSPLAKVVAMFPGSQIINNQTDNHTDKGA